MANIDNEYYFGRITQNERNDFNQMLEEKYIWRESPTLLIRDELLPHQQFQPQFIFQQGERSFYLTSLLTPTDPHQREPRDQIMAYVIQEGERDIQPRVFFRSVTSGSWRVVPCGRRWGTYSKGLGVHYTQETKVQEDLITCLEQVEDESPAQVYGWDVLLKQFVWDGEFLDKYPPKRPLWLTYPDEMTVIDNKGLLYPLTHFRPSSYRVDEWDKGTDIAAWLAKFDFGKPEIAGFVPDFTQPPLGTHTYRHTLLGQVYVEDFSAQFQGVPIKWSMAFDQDKRVWVDRIVPTDFPVNTYGVYSAVLNSGAITNKPIDRKGNVTLLKKGSDCIEFDGEHADITPLLYQLAPIKQYRDLKFGK